MLTKQRAFHSVCVCVFVCACLCVCVSVRATVHMFDCVYTSVHACVCVHVAVWCVGHIKTILLHVLSFNILSIMLETHAD